MNFDEWYEQNKEIVSQLTFECALKRVWIESRVERETERSEAREKLRRITFMQGKYGPPDRCFSCGGASHSFDCR